MPGSATCLFLHEMKYSGESMLRMGWDMVLTNIDRMGDVRHQAQQTGRSG